MQGEGGDEGIASRATGTVIERVAKVLGLRGRTQ